MRFILHIRRRHLVQSSSFPFVVGPPSSFSALAPNRNRYSAPDKQSLVLDNDEDDDEVDHNIIADASPSELKTRSEQMPEKVKPKQDSNTADCSTTLVVDNTTSISNHIKHISGTVNADDLYALPSKRKLQTTNGDGTASVENCIDGAGGHHQVNESTSADEEDDADNEEKGKTEEVEDKDASKDLPPGWEKHEGKRSLEYLRNLGLKR